MRFYFWDRFIFLALLPQKGETFLWEINDGKYLYRDIFKIGLIEKERLFGIQLIVGPLLVSLAWLRPNF